MFLASRVVSLRDDELRLNNSFFSLILSINDRLKLNNTLQKVERRFFFNKGACPVTKPHRAQTTLLSRGCKPKKKHKYISIRSLSYNSRNSVISIARIYLDQTIIRHRYQ